MAINNELLGPQKSEEEAFAIEALVFSTQVALQKAMNQKGVGNKELSERLGMSPARVSQIFSSNGPNLTLKMIARIAHALGEDFELIRREDGNARALPEESARHALPCAVDGRMTQNQVILKHLNKTGSITVREAVVEYSIQSLTKRVQELRESGYHIKSHVKYDPVTGQKYVRYTLETVPA